MASLPAIDLGLMAEHLAAHEGIINKLDLYQRKVTDADLKEILIMQANMMREHVQIMLDLINPYQNSDVDLPTINEYVMDYQKKFVENQATNTSDKWIALEGHTTAKSMANENFSSALMMKDPIVRYIHVKMALQQIEMQEKYEAFINKRGWTFTPHASTEEQINTFDYYQPILTEI